MDNSLTLMFIFIVLFLLFGTIIVVAGILTDKKNKGSTTYLASLAGRALMIVAGVIFFGPWINHGGRFYIETLIISALLLLFGTIIVVVGIITDKGNSEYSSEMVWYYGIAMFIAMIITLILYFWR